MALTPCRHCPGAPIVEPQLSRRPPRCRPGAPPQQRAVGVPPPGPPPPPTGAAALGPASWFQLLLIAGITATTLAGGFILFVLYLRPLLAAAQRATLAAERAALEMEVAARVGSGRKVGHWGRLGSWWNPGQRHAPCGTPTHRVSPPPPPPQEMERTARMMQEDMPLTFQDLQRTSKEVRPPAVLLLCTHAMPCRAVCCMLPLAAAEPHIPAAARITWALMPLVWGWQQHPAGPQACACPPPPTTPPHPACPV